ncbi:uncharacterized protein LOC126715577 isoform X8 [Quercus robur]|uniref:uncharacterized protein LOC126715577 isoform X7 n=1 Tax=Quercus robur TaxID=38942 RepID=UPI00216125FD|nr:uncharacterized protein LOC126715577 isoform X7 [Quercus robur]XP_050272202.1 uncharacterized protein LOC126715577 isoform X8 [Quercus robur]
MLRTLVHAPTLCCLSGPSPSNSTSSDLSRPSMATSARIAVIGDIHNDWNLQEDTKALQFLQPDLVLFTGDFGEENVELVQSAASLEFAKAAILGNHDAWYTQQFSGKRKDGVQLQLECLGEEHVAYQHLDFPLIKVSIVGGRPFSCGGEQLFRKKLLSARYGVQDMDGSARRIYNAALGTPEDHFVILLAHNGPTGLGSNLNDICGKDWVFGGGDHGDPDLEQAISLLKETGKSCVPLVVFGHMHKELAYRKGLRKMIVVGDDNTIYLNGAIVPRVTRLNNEQGTGNRSFMNDETPVLTPESEGTMRAFTLVEILDGRVEKITESWVSVVGDNTTLAEEQLLFKRGS